MVKVAPLPLLDPDTQMDRGGFGSIFPDPRNPNHCIKSFAEPLRGEAAVALSRLVDVGRWARPSVAHTLTTRFAWPLEIFGTEEEIRGYVMPLAPESTKFTLNILGRESPKFLQAMYLFDAEYFTKPAIRSRPPDVTHGDRIEILLDLHYALQVLHQNGLVYGDISAKNVTIRVEEWPGVFLFDADSITTVSQRDKNPLLSPGWETPPDLGALEIDRSRFSLFVLRLLHEKLNAVPGDPTFSQFAHRFGSELAGAISALYETGSVENLDTLIEALRRRRDHVRASLAVQRAGATGFARFVMREARHAATREDERLLLLASNQVTYEAVVEGLAGKKRREAAARETLQRSGFILDVSPTFALAAPPTTDQELKELIYQAMFQELASHRASEGFLGLEGHGWMKRAVEHALIEGADPEVSITPITGSATIRIWWPPDPYVNSVMLKVHLGQSFDPVVFRRGDNDNQMVHVVDSPSGGELSVEVIGGSASVDGVIFWSPNKVTARVQIPAIPAPTQPRTAAHSPASTRPTLVTRIYDPEEERQRLLQERLLAEEEKRQQRRRLLSRIAASAVAIPILVLAAWFALFAGSDEPTTTMAQGATPITGLTLEVAGSTVIARWERSFGADGERPAGHEIHWHSETQRGRPSERVGPAATSSVALSARTAVSFHVRTIFPDGSRGEWAQTPVILLDAHESKDPHESLSATGVFGSPSLVVSDVGIAVKFLGAPATAGTDRISYRVSLGSSGRPVRHVTVSSPGLVDLGVPPSGQITTGVQLLTDGLAGPPAHSRSVTIADQHPMFDQ